MKHTWPALETEIVPKEKVCSQEFSRKSSRVKEGFEPIRKVETEFFDENYFRNIRRKVCILNGLSIKIRKNIFMMLEKNQYEI